MNDETLLTDEEIDFFNICLAFVFFKLKEYPNARILTEEILQKV